MKVKNQHTQKIPIQFVKLDQKVSPEKRDTSPLPYMEIPPNQIAEIPDLQWEALKKTLYFKTLLKKKFLKVLEGKENVLPGDGDPDCEYCYGRGFVIIDGNSGKRCVCAMKRDIIANVRGIWPNVDLLQSARLKSPSPLLSMVKEPLWITSDQETFQKHLRYVALRQGPHWHCRVRNDTDIMSAWFANAKAKSIEIFDTDVVEARAKDLELMDLAEGPDLLILWLGIKRARNVATPEALMEVMSIRDMQNKPTWVVDQPNFLVTEEAHRCNSPEVLTHLRGYERVRLDRLSPVTSNDEFDDLLEAEDDEGEAPVKRKKSSRRKSAKKSTAKAGAPWAKKATGDTSTKPIDDV